MCCQVPSMQNSSHIRPHVVRKIAAAVAEHQMGGSRPSSKDRLKASVRHTTTCTRSQVCLSDGEYIYIYIYTVAWMASTPHCQSIYVFSLTSQARFPTQGTRRTAHSKKPLQHKSCRRCLYKRGSLFAHIASSRGLCQNIGLLRRGINAMDWSDFAMESFESVSADQKQHIMDLPASWSPIGISKKWRVCPLFVSMWLCLFSRASVSEEARNKAVATPRCFVMALREAKKQSNWTPSPAQVFTHFSQAG